MRHQVEFKNASSRMVANLSTRLGGGQIDDSNLQNPARIGKTTQASVNCNSMSRARQASDSPRSSPEGLSVILMMIVDRRTVNAARSLEHGLGALKKQVSCPAKPAEPSAHWRDDASFCHLQLNEQSETGKRFKSLTSPDEG
jgi:hypothetical protein